MPLLALLMAAIGMVATPTAAAGPDLAGVLRAAVQSSRVADGLVVVYDDIHPLHGGERIEIRADGRATRRDVVGDRATTRTARVAPGDLLRLQRLLVEIAAWEPRTPTRTAVPDESRTTLTVQAGGATATTWEWYDDLAANRRIARVKALLEQLVPAP